MKRPIFHVVSIVEGYGEVFSVPILLKRWFRYRRFNNFTAREQAIRAPGCGALKAEHSNDKALGVEHYVQLALGDAPDGILIVIDADKECITRSKRKGAPGLGPELLERARKTAPHVPVAVVVANREFEAWLLANCAALVKAGQIKKDTARSLPFDVDSIVNPKGTLGHLMDDVYEPRVDQARLVHYLSFASATMRRSHSYGKLVTELERLAKEARERRVRGKKL